MLKKIANWIARKQNSIFTYPVQKQRTYIEKLGTPRDELERSFFQYRCQMKFHGVLLATVLNLAALPMSLLYLLKFRANHVVFSQNQRAVFLNHGLPENIVPNSLREEYGQILALSDEHRSLDREDIRFLRKLFVRYPFSWLLWLKVIYKVGKYSTAIKKYAPKAVVCCDEYSYSSPAVTAYCREKNVERINVMHGEKLYFMRDSFVCYDRYYVWDQCYADLLVEMGGEKSQFRVEVPDSLRLQSEGNVEKTCDYTYYLASEDRPTLEKIAASMKQLQTQGKTVVVRPHPRYTNLKEMQPLFDGIMIEEGAEISIEESLCRTRNAIALYSSTLNQAYHNGTGVIIDDISAPDQFRKLKDLKYCMLDKEHRLLSEVMGEKG